MRNGLSGVPGGVLTLEMQPDQIVVRGISSESRVNLYVFAGDWCSVPAVQEYHFGRKSHLQVSTACRELQWKDYSQLTATTRRMKQMHGIHILVVDYLQLVTCPAAIPASRRSEKDFQGLQIHCDGVGDSGSGSIAVE